MVRTIPRLLLLDRVDPGEPDHQQDDQPEEHQLDSNREAYEAAGPARPRAALLAVGRVRDQLRAAPVARDLEVFHANEYATSVAAGRWRFSPPLTLRRWNSRRRCRRQTWSCSSALCRSGRATSSTGWTRLGCATATALPFRRSEA